MFGVESTCRSNDGVSVVTIGACDAGASDITCRLNDSVLRIVE